MPITRRIVLLLPFLAAAPARAQDAGGAVEAFHAALMDAMRNARALGAPGRERKLRPVMERSFDLAAMARIAVGPGWSQLLPPQQQAVARAFADWIIATYAGRFDGFSGESFATLGEQTLANGDRLVRTELRRPSEPAVAFNYLVRGGRIVDIYLAGTISELASRRAEFAGLLRDGGPERLVGELRQRTEKLLAG